MTSSAMWVGKTGLSAQDKNLSTIANNLANASTVGFKRDRAVFEDLLYQVQRQPGAQSSQNSQLPSGLQLGTGVRVAGTHKQFTEGNLQVTEQSLDWALNGRGFFQISLPDGSIGYTRNGQFHLNSEGTIVDVNGFPLEPAITVPQGATNLNVSKDGIVSVVMQGQAGVTQIGNIQTVDFINPAGLEAKGSNLFVETAASGTPQTGTAGKDGFGTIEQGNLESSNVDVVEEMVNMITTQRVYEMNSKVLSTADQMLQYLTQQV